MLRFAHFTLLPPYALNKSSQNTRTAENFQLYREAMRASELPRYRVGQLVLLDGSK